ncbi:ribonuclease H-like domain-containing protein [Tanacetum coccineum]
MSKEKIKAVFEEFKKYEDDRVEQRCIKMNARLDKLSVDFEEEIDILEGESFMNSHWVIENQIDHKVKAIKCDNGTEFKNQIMNEFCEMKGIRREFSVARTPQQKCPKSSKDEVADDARKKNEVLDPAKEGDMNGQGEAADTNNTNRLNTVSSSVNTVTPTFTTMDTGRKRTQRNEFESVFGQARQVWSGQPTDPQHTSTFAQLSIEEPITVLSSSKLKKTHKPRKAKRTTEISQSSGHAHLVKDESVYKEWEDRMERAATTASSLEAEQDSEAQTRFEVASKPFNDPPLLRVNTLGSGKDSMKPKGIDGTCCLPTPVEMRLHSQVLNVVPGGLPLLSLVDEIGLCTFPKSPTVPHDSPLLGGHTPRSDEGSLPLHELTVKKLEQTVQTSQARRRAKIVVSDDEEDKEDPSK